MTQADGRFSARCDSLTSACSTITITADLMPRKAACTSGTAPNPT